METLGNISLLDRKKIGYFASSKITTLSVLPTLDWAAEVASREDVAIVSGYHSKMEREVLDFLIRGKCGIVCVLARSIYKKIPDKFREAYDSGRDLPETGSSILSINTLDFLKIMDVPFLHTRTFQCSSYIYNAKVAIIV